MVALGLFLQVIVSHNGFTDTWKKLRGRRHMVFSTEAWALKLGLRLLHSTADNLANGPCYAALILWKFSKISSLKKATGPTDPPVH